MTHAFEIHEFGFAKLRFVEREVPAPGAYEVLVRMSAASLNFRDVAVVEGLYNPHMRLPMVPLSDGVGTVEAIGASVTRVKPGERVAGIFMQRFLEGPPSKQKSASALGGAIDGVLRETMLFHEDGLVPVPAHLSDVEAATLPCAAVTAWHALFEETPVRPGETVLIQGTGGVALFAVQFAAAAGVRSIVISSSDEKLERVRAMGANETVNYRREPDWDKAVRGLTDGDGVDHIIELGGADTLAKSLKAIRVGGVISVIGALSGGGPAVSPIPILMQNLRVQGIYVGSRRMFENMNRLIGQRQLHPIIDRVYDWRDAREALEAMPRGQHFGKICLKF